MTEISLTTDCTEHECEPESEIEKVRFKISDKAMIIEFIDADNDVLTFAEIDKDAAITLKHLI